MLEQFGRCRGVVLFVGGLGRFYLGARGLEAGAEAAQIAVHRLAVLADGGFQLLRLNRQASAAGDGAQHHRVDDRAALLGQRLHVEQQCRARVLLDRVDQPVLVEAAVAHGDLFVHGIEAAERADQHRAIRRDEAVRHRAAGFQQFARHRDVDVADAGGERQHRPLAAQVTRKNRKDLDVISGGAGALRDAGDRGALHRISGLFGGADDPVGQHAAAFAAERGDQQGDRAWRAHAETFASVSPP